MVACTSARVCLEDADTDGEEHVEAHRTDEFDRKYLDDRSWEVLVEDERGRLVAAQATTLHKRSVRATDTSSRIRRGLIRYLFLAVDMSEACATTTDMPPNRAVVLTSLAKSFITEFFDQNPLSQMSVQVMRHGRVDTLSELSASMGKHVHVLEGSISTGGAISLQNMLDAAIQTSQGIPPFGSREVLVLLSSLTTCDPGSIADSMKAAKEAKLRVSIIGLSAEMYVSRKLATETGGTYHVAMSQDHLSELLTQACSPPPLPAAQLQPSLVKMAFPSKDADTLRSFAFVGEACEVATGAYSCPQCAAKNGSIPCNCHICGVTLISAPHLARSYHHLFPIAGFEEVQLKDSANQLCSFCSGHLPAHASGGLSSAGLAYRCSQCRSLCCMDCDDFVHEHLHNCPGCEELCNL